MAMTLKLLKSRCYTELGRNNLGVEMPSVDVEIRKAITTLIRKVGGVKGSANITLVEGQREYSHADGFPQGCIGIYRVIDATDGRRLVVMPRNERPETGSTGNPSGYYIWSPDTIGFDHVVDAASAGRIIRVDYFGLGTPPESSSDEILSWLPALQDDSLWDAIVFEVAYVYYRRVREPASAEEYRRLASRARYEVMGAVNMMNRDEAFEVRFEEDYFSPGWNSFLDRFGGEGDIISFFR